jgi:hypothetical protein
MPPPNAIGSISSISLIISKCILKIQQIFNVFEMHSKNKLLIAGWSRVFIDNFIVLPKKNGEDAGRQRSEV